MLTDLPSPLSLEQALALANSSHPDLSLAYAELGLAQSQKLEAQSSLGVNAYIELTPETANPTTRNDYIDDSRARMFIGKTLFDSGLTRALETSAEANITSNNYVVLSTKLNHDIDIMQLFYSVILADLRYNVDNEELAQRFISYDRLRERYELGQVSETDLLEAENIYREVQDRKTKSEKQLHATRQRLAFSLNRPTDLPRELIWPVIQHELQQAPDYNTLFKSAIISNPVILSLKYKVNSAKAELEAERARKRPTLKAELELSEYARNLPGRSNARGGLSLRIPLFQGGKVNAAIARAASKLSKYKSQLLQAEYTLRQKCLDLIQRLETLYMRRKTAQQRLKYRDRNLDKQRALYEMEIQSSLGNAMTKMTEAQWQAAKIDFDISLTSARINALLGKSLINDMETKTQ